MFWLERDSGSSPGLKRRRLAAGVVGVGVRWERKAAQGQLPGGETLESGTPFIPGNWQFLRSLPRGRGTVFRLSRQKTAGGVGQGGERPSPAAAPEVQKAGRIGPSCVFRPQIDAAWRRASLFTPPPPPRLAHRSV